MTAPKTIAVIAASLGLTLAAQASFAAGHPIEFTVPVVVTPKGGAPAPAPLLP